jgi:hypothetical protein
LGLDLIADRRVQQALPSQVSDVSENRTQRLSTHSKPSVPPARCGDTINKKQRNKHTDSDPNELGEKVAEECVTVSCEAGD